MAVKLRDLIPLLPVLAGIMWGSIGVFVRTLDAGGLDNGTIVCTRMMVSALIMAFFILMTDRHAFAVPKKAIPLLLVGAIVGSSYMNVVYNIAIMELHLALSSVLIGLFALWAIFLGRIFFGEPLTARKLICVAVALFGVVLVSGLLEQGDVGTLSLFGLFMGFMTGIMYAINGLTTRYMTDWGMKASTINFWYFAIGAVSLLPLCHWDQVATFVGASPLQGVAWLVGQSLVCAILPYVLFTVALRNMDMGIASTLELIEPATAMFLGFVLFGEVPTPLMVVGVVLVIVAIAASFRNPASVKPEIPEGESELE